jgi:hypothetical protein
MSKQDIRLKTVVIIEKDHEYLIGRCVVTGVLRWSNSPYDAFGSRSIDKAMRVAWKVGGNIMLFNPIVGQIKSLKRAV